jgi:hypothetical protein
VQGSGRGLIWGGRSFCQSFSTWSARCEDKYCPVDVLSVLVVIWNNSGCDYYCLLTCVDFKFGRQVPTVCTAQLPTSS